MNWTLCCGIRPLEDRTFTVVGIRMGKRRALKFVMLMFSTSRNNSEFFESLCQRYQCYLRSAVDGVIPGLLSDLIWSYGATLGMKERRFNSWCENVISHFRVVSHFRKRVMKAKLDYFLCSRSATVDKRKFIFA